MLGEGALVELPPCDGGNDYQDYQPYQPAKFLHSDNKLSVISYTASDLRSCSHMEKVLVTVKAVRDSDL